MTNLNYLSTKTISKLIFLSGIFTLMIIIFSCESDDNNISDATQPSVNEFLTELSSAPGLEFFVVGNITDDKGIKSINLRYEPWFLDKTISLDEAPTSFDLNYKFLVPEDEILGSSHNVMVSITDVGNNLINREVTVVLNTDTTNPEINIMSPLSGSFYENGADIPFEISISDNFELQSLQVISESLNLNDTTEFSNSENSFTYTNTISVPDNIEGTVLIEAIVTDGQGNTQTDTITINVGAEVVYTDMYIVGGSTWFGWDPSKATRMEQDSNDEDWFEVELYYSTGNNIKFIGQLDWAPNNWGLDPNDDTQIINAEDSEAIGFPEGDGYYRIRFNPYTLQYTYETMTVDVEQRNEMYVMGKGYTNFDLDWSPADGIPMVQDSNNPYQFSIDIEFSDAVDLKYLGQNSGWGPYDCGFEVGGETSIPVNYVKNQVGDGTADLKFIGLPGNYRIIFDYFLLRTSIQPVN